MPPIDEPHDDSADPHEPEDIADDAEDEVADEAEDDRPQWLVDLDEEAAQSEGSGFQFGLLALFGLMTVSAIYVYMERRHQGQFGVHLLGGIALWLGLILPGIGLLLWVVRLVADASSPWVLLWFCVGLAGAIVFALLQFPGF